MHDNAVYTAGKIRQFLGECTRFIFRLFYVLPKLNVLAKGGSGGGVQAGVITNFNI